MTKSTSARRTRATQPLTAEALLRDWPRNAGGRDYIDGCESGRLAALAFVRKSASESPDRPADLQHIAFALFEQLRHTGCDIARPDPRLPQAQVARGLVVGFFIEIERALRAARLQVTIADEALASGLADAAAGGPGKRFERLAREQEAAEPTAA